jgi:hypothetical protein
MATIAIETPAPASLPRPRRRVAVLTSGCDGYRAGTAGEVIGERDGCIVFAPDRPEDVARWARPRTSLLVPPALILSV